MISRSLGPLSSVRAVAHEEQILQELQAQGKVTIAELVRRLGVSAPTIRGDLDRL